MTKENKINRRKFIGSTAAAAATISIVPRHVVAGSGKTPPSEKIAIANIGCGTQGMREMDYMLNDDRAQVVAVCDPNKFSTNYLDWGPHNIRDLVRKGIGDPSWGSDLKGIPGGRDLGKMYVEGVYGQQKKSGSYQGCKAYEDFRELLEEEDIDAVKIMTPDHLHATIALAAMDKGLDTLTHKPIANRMAEARKVIKKAEESEVLTHLLAWCNRPQFDLIKYWIDDGVIGQLKEIHNWSRRPMWKHFQRAPTDRPSVPEGFNWDLWLGPVPDRPYHPDYTHNVFRGWYDFGGGSFVDMGHYSLFALFESFGITRPAVSATANATQVREMNGHTFRKVAFDATYPYSSAIHLKMPEQPTMEAFDLYWYDGGVKPFLPKEMEADYREVPEEGMFFVGDKGRILTGFSGTAPRILPLDRMRRYKGLKTVKGGDNSTYNTFPWIDHLHDRTPLPGSFIRAKTVTETINLGNIALRAGRRVDYDSDAMRITSNESDNQFLSRTYRPGWEI